MTGFCAISSRRQGTNIGILHELALIKKHEHEHNYTFSQLCQYMKPDYHKLEFDLRAMQA